MNYDMQDFNKDIIEQSYNIPVLVDFWAEWCGPCKVLGPTLEKLAEKYKGQWKLVKLNTDENQDISMKYGIRGIPNVKLFINGKVKDEFTGALSEAMVEDWLKKAIPGKNSKKVEEAKLLIRENKLKDAQNLLQSIYDIEPSNEEAKILLAKTLVFEDFKLACSLSENVDGKLENYELSESIQMFGKLFEKGENAESLPESEVKAKYIKAINNLREQNFDASLELFIDVIRNEKSYDDEGSRKACIAIFKFLGEDNPVTLKHRRDFGSALYI